MERWIEQLESRLCLSTVYWDGGGDGASWTDPLNWDTDTLPDATTDVVIDVADEPTVTVGINEWVTAKSVLSRERLVFQSGADLELLEPSRFEADLETGGGFGLHGGGQVTFDALFDAEGVVLDTGGAITIGPTGTFRLGGYSVLRRDISSVGLTEWHAQVVTLEGVTFLNSGSWICDTTLTAEIRTGDSDSTFRNEGDATKVGSGELICTDSSDVPLRFENAGTVSVQGGRLMLGEGGDHTGAFEVGAAGELAFAGAQALDPGVTITGAGVVEFSTVVEIECTIDIGELRVSSGAVEMYTGFETSRGITLTGNGALNMHVPWALRDVRIEDGGVGGTADIDFVGTLVWNRGSIFGTGARRLVAGTAVALAGTGKKSLGTDVTNETLIIWTGGDLSTGYQGGRLINLGQIAVDISPSQQHTLPDLLNQGEIHVTRGSLLTSAPIETTGAFSISSGTLVVERGGVLAGDIELLGSQAALVLRGTDLEMPQGATITGSGRVTFAGDQPGFDVYTDVSVGQVLFNGFNRFHGSVTANNGLNVAAGSTSFFGTLSLRDNQPIIGRGDVYLGSNDLRVSSGTIGALQTDGLLEASGELSWPSGTLSGSGLLRILPGGTLDVPENFRRYIGLDIENQGTLVWPNNTTVFQDATIENLGLIVAEISNFANTEGPGALINRGVLVQRGVALVRIGRADQGFTFTNEGQVVVERSELHISGSLDLEGELGVLVRGTWEVAGGAELFVNEGTLIRVIGDDATVRLLASQAEMSGLDGLTALRGTLELLDGASLTATPRVEHFMQSGTLRVGIGSRLSVVGYWGQTAAALTRVDVEGTDGPTQHGRLRATETIWLAGRFELLAADGYVPDEGAQHEILTAASVRGEFGDLTLPDAQPTDKWALRYDADGLTAIHTDIADMNLDGMLDARDAILLFNLWAQGDDRADLNGDGVVDTQDVLLWLNAWADG